MNILWLSWRDIKNPQGGGAEKVAIEVAKRFVRDGSNVTIFTSSFEKAKPQERVNGVNIIRKGNRLTCRLYAFLYYRKNPNFDVVIDEINTIPFFSNFYAKSKSVCLIHQLAKEYWFKQTFFPLNIIGYFIEPFWLKLYRNFPTLALSKSTKNDLTNIGFNNVSIYKIGLDFKPELITDKQKLIVMLGRINKVKKYEDGLKAFKIISKVFPDMKLFVIGKGEKKYLNYLKSLSRKLMISKSIVFTGYLPDKKKISYLKKAQVTLIPGIREGWNLVTLESSALCTVPVAYNIPGIKDSVLNKKTGLLVQPNFEALATGALNLLQNQTARLEYAKRGYIRSKEYTWDKTFNDFKKKLKDR